MACGCGGRRAARGQSMVRTSGDAGTVGSYMTPTDPVPEPLAVVPDSVEEVPEGARYRVVQDGQVAYFAAHGPAFSWQGEHGGKLRTI
jgi:hypothetical protein